MARSQWKRHDFVYLLGVLGTAAVALRRRRAVLVVIVGGHCRSCSWSIVDENAGCGAARCREVKKPKGRLDSTWQEKSFVGLNGVAEK